MKPLVALLLATPFSTVLPALGRSAEPAPVRVDLEPKPWKLGDVTLPAARWETVAAGFPVRHSGGARFATVLEGDILRADLDGDGNPDARVEGEEASLTLTGKSPEGNAIRYPVRLARFNGGPWMFSTGGSMAGKVGETTIQIIDQNLNGSFNDVGEDAIVVGRDAAASYLSKVISVDGKLWSLDVARDGSSMAVEPYSGPAGLLDLTTLFESKAKLRSAIVRSKDGKHSFSMAKAKRGLSIPAGEYELCAGELVLGDSKAKIARGRSKPIVVPEGGSQVIPWGGPVSAEFQYSREGGKVTFTPWDLWVYGRLGEEYSNFLPLGKSPEFFVTNKTTGESLIHAQLPGNC